MTSKLNYYDVLGVLLPGVLVVAVLTWLLPMDFGAAFKGVPAGLLTITVTGIALVAGQAVHGLGSLIEPLLFRSWGGVPSHHLLSDSPIGAHYLPAASVKRIRKKLEAEVPKGKAKDLFLYALTAAGGEKGRVGIFNSLYAHHRSLFIASLITIFVIACRWSTERIAEFRCELLILAILLALLFWWRARARAYYFAREVLLAAEKELK